MFYPKAPEAKPVAVEVDEVVEAAGMIEIMETGEEDAVVIISKQLAGRDLFPELKRVYEKLMEDRSDAQALNPADFDTETSFKSGIMMACPYADTKKWVDGLKAENEVTKWDELKAAKVEIGEMV